MASPGSSDRDQSLLSRLNALKPTNINLTPGISTGEHASPVNSGETAVDKQPVSREDVLAERLRILRNQPERKGPVEKRGGSPLTGGTLSPSAYTQPQSPMVSRQGIPNKQEQKVSQIPHQDAVDPITQGPGDNAAGYGNVDNDDYLQFLQSGDPDQSLDEILEGLEDDEDLDGPVSLSEFGVGGEVKKVSDLLERFQKHSAGTGHGGASTSTDGHAVTGEGSGEPLASRGIIEDDDDSESEQMTRDVEKILSQIKDEITVADDKGGSDTPHKTDERKAGKPGPSAPGDDPVPDSSDPFTLPNAPASPLRDLLDDDPAQNSKQEDRKSFDFENDIVARMASLKGLGSGINVDSFGLPVAPTFAPQDRSSPGANNPKAKGAGYTDEDQKTWCIVCLDDATIRCVGCDDDVYCARCWKDMHMGPSAGYDERGHRWVKFVR